MPSLQVLKALTKGHLAPSCRQGQARPRRDPECEVHIPVTSVSRRHRRSSSCRSVFH